MTVTEQVALIGAGLSGLTLALALHQQSIPCIVYEGRSAPEDIRGAIILSPNALRILDELHIYARIRSLGHESETVLFRTEDDQLVDSYEIGNEKYGYKGLRIYRYALINELLAALAERHIPVHYGKKFVRIRSESEHAMSWEWGDGIYSRVRAYLYPELKPQFIGIVAVAAAVPTSCVDVPEGYGLPVAIMSQTHGGYIIAPQLPDGSELMLGRQRRWSELDREGWEALAADEGSCIDFLSQGAEHFPPIIRSSVANIQRDKINVWPFYVVPRLDRWVSDYGRVAIIGDAAHAIPPSSGQGANQVLEDSYTYALLRGQCTPGAIGRALRRWKEGRQEKDWPAVEIC
jgi:2-polyprenyl-6-methoxyphenol hydroxylase-like FAD-dependent oxidoreductase